MGHFVGRHIICEVFGASQEFGWDYSMPLSGFPGRRRVVCCVFGIRLGEGEYSVDEALHSWGGMLPGFIVHALFRLYGIYVYELTDAL